jgi:hypothetical protein
VLVHPYFVQLQMVQPDLGPDELQNSSDMSFQTRHALYIWYRCVATSWSYSPMLQVIQCNLTNVLGVVTHGELAPTYLYIVTYLIARWPTMPAYLQCTKGSLQVEL